MENLLYISFRKTKKVYILFISLFIQITQLVPAQINFVSDDGGLTYYPDCGVYSDSSYAQENPNSVSSYTKILEMADNQYPLTGLAAYTLGDANKNGKMEMYRAVASGGSPLFVRVYEFDDDLNYTIIDLQYYGIPWAITDINGNGKTDLIIQYGTMLRVYESQDQSSLPTVLIAEVNTGGNVYNYARAVDTDQDGKKEVLINRSTVFGNGDLRIYEWEINSLQHKWTSPEISYIPWGKAVSDFDINGKIEIATVETSTETVYVYECIGNDTYDLKSSWSLPSEYPPYIIWYASALQETNPDDGNPSLAIGIHYSLSGGGGERHQQWFFYKEVSGSFSVWTESPVYPTSWNRFISHTTGDYDRDGLDEIIVYDPNYLLRMLKYVNGQIQEVWATELTNPYYSEIGLMSLDMRNDNFVNFSVVDGDKVIFFEEERLANAYLNKSLTASATAHNNNHVIERGYYGKLHEVFTSGGEIFYRRSSNNGTSWELTTRISNVNDFNNHPSIVAAGLGAKDYLCLVWQRKLTNYQYEIYTAYSSNSGTSWTQLTNPIAVTVSYNQSNQNYGPGSTPIVASYQNLGQKYLVVYATESGLYYRTASFGSDWSTATLVPGSYGLNSSIWYPSVATYSNLSTQVNLIYDDRFIHVYSQVFNGSSWATRVVVDWTGSYNRTSSIAVDYANSTLGVWSGWNGNNFRIRFRQGYSNGAWSKWCKEWSISEVNSICPAITYYNKGGDYPYGIDILWCTESPSQEIHQKKYYGLGDNWIPADPNTQLIAEDGLYANVTHERQNTPVPIQIWSDQSEEPYSILYNSDYLPKGDMLVGGEIRRAAEITNANDNSHLRIELSEPIITLTNNEQIKIPFKTYNYLDTLELTTENIFDFLQTELVSIPYNAQSLTFNVEINADQPDTLSDGSINNNRQTPFRSINFGLRARNDSSRVLLNNIGNRWLNNNSGLHHYSKEITINASVLRGRNIRMMPNIILSGLFNNAELYFTLVNVSIEGDGIGKGSLETKNNIIPSEFSLEQNFPNPFNPTTQIKYSVRENGLVTLKIYDVLGKEVAALVNEEKQAGIYTVTFDAGNLASGIYFYRISANDFHQTKKMLLIK